MTIIYFNETFGKRIVNLSLIEILNFKIVETFTKN